MSIPESLTAKDLLDYLWCIISGFLDRKVKITSYASDGSTVERATQRLLEEKATSNVSIVIKHPHDGPGASDFVIKIPFYGDQPIATIQDPKHLLKTFRNNLYSGARMLTFPTDIATYSQVRRISVAADSPIYIRDVEKADRQDDNAATRLFSGATLEWLVKNHPEDLGLMMYLFICGELIDAYQNRFVTIVERAKMVLRAHFFIELWEKFLATAGYPKSRHYVSPQCADIARILIQGFFQVLIIYRDFSGPIRPLLLWLLATEVIEHVFGLSRQIVKDFTMLDFHHMIPKLFIRLRQAALSSKFTDGKATASGYSHTYTDTRGINIQALSTYPTNSDLDDAAKCAYGEAESLFSILGVTASDLFLPPVATRLPGIQSWFKDEVNAIFIDASDDNSDDGDQSDSDGELDPSSVRNHQEAMDRLEDADDNLSPRAARSLMDHRYASIALSIDNYQKMYVSQHALCKSLTNISDLYKIDCCCRSSTVTTLTKHSRRMQIKYLLLS